MIRPGYGLAEATLGVTSVRAGENIRLDARGNVACGRPFDDIEVRIDGGEILVRSAGVFAGYFDANDATRETLRDGWLHTGDIGKLDADGNLYVLARKRAMLKRGGVPLAPRELEEAALTVPGVRIAAAVALPPAADRVTEEIVITVESNDADHHAMQRAVAHAVESAIGFTPDRVLVLARRAIPRTHNGKIRHDVLRSMLAGFSSVRSNPSEICEGFASRNASSHAAAEDASASSESLVGSGSLAANETP